MCWRDIYGWDLSWLSFRLEFNKKVMYAKHVQQQVSPQVSIYYSVCIDDLFGLQMLGYQYFDNNNVNN